MPYHRRNLIETIFFNRYYKIFLGLHIFLKENHGKIFECAFVAFALSIITHIKMSEIQIKTCDTIKFRNILCGIHNGVFRSRKI